MKFFFSFLFFLICSYDLLANDKTSFIDIDYLLNNTTIGKKIFVELENFNKKNIEKLSNLEKTILLEKEKINKTKNVISEDEYLKNIKILDEKIISYNKEKNEAIQTFNNEKNKKINYFIDSIRPIIQNYMETNDIAILINKKNVFIGKSEFEITNDINELINLKIK